jgi:2-polyprenyl-3-methyl-5-hydroxy-6-metoxy-1,4-benzoquinol methylase
MATRVREQELMDDPQLDRGMHIQAMRGLSRIYSASRPWAALWPHIQREPRAVTGPLRVLDIATGGGDWPLDLARRARRKGLAVQVAACDVNSRAIAFARLRARRARVNVRFFTLDACEQPLPDDYHVLTSSLFLHHLDEQRAVSLLAKMAAAARRTVLVDDLRRTRRGLWLAWLATRTLSRSPVVRTDGPRSVRAAFTTAELHRLAERAGLACTTVVRHWPQRHLLVWRR